VFVFLCSKVRLLEISRCVQMGLSSDIDSVLYIEVDSLKFSDGSNGLGKEGESRL